MKKAIKILVVTAFFLTVPFVMMAQSPPHPNGGNDPSSGGNTPVGGAAPIDGGISLMLILGAAYGSKKAYKAFKS